MDAFEAPEAPRPARSRIRPLALVALWLVASVALRVVIEVGTGLALVGSGMARGLSLEDMSDPSIIQGLLSATLMGAVSLFQIVALAALAVGFALLLDSDLRSALGLNRPRTAALVLGGLGGLTVGFFPGWVAQTLSERVPWLDLGNLELLNEMLATASLGGKLVMLVAIAFAAPVFEELIFRGFLWSALDRALPPVVTWLVTSALFALYHVDPVHVIAVFFTGLFLGWLRWMSGSIAPSIAAHFANNALAAVVVLFVPDVESATNTVGPAVLSVVASLAFGAALWALRVRPEQSPSPSP